MICMVCLKAPATVQNTYRYYCDKCAIKALKDKPAHKKNNLKKIKG